MAVLKFLKGVRNHWKKSLFAASALAYGASYANEKYEINQLMRQYCEEAAKYGDVIVDDVTVPPKRILVILNPAANKKSAEKPFQKYCEPVLHLAGFLVDIVKTDSEGHALRYVEELKQLPDAILVAGGDGTLSETVTGLLRRPKREKCPVGVLPVGRTNSVATKIYNLKPNSSGLEEVRGMVHSAISVVRGRTAKKDIMEIQVMPDEESEPPPKPIFAVGSFQWGAFRDAHSLQDKYWYLGPFRDYAASLFNAFSDKLTWNCTAQINYTPPCPGCKNCYIKEPEPQQISTGRWWSRFIPRFSLNQARAQQVPEYSKVMNENCTKVLSSEVNPSELVLSVDSGEGESQATDALPHSLKINVGYNVQGGFDFIGKSWSRIRTHEVDVKNRILARTVELIPAQVSTEEKEIFYSIDNEPYEVRPVKISLVPKAIDMYTL